MPDALRLQIRDLTHDAGYWTATVHLNGLCRDVDRKFGSWQQLVPITGRINGEETSVVVRRELPRWVAAALAERVRPLDRKRKAEEAAIV